MARVKSGCARCSALSQRLLSLCRARAPWRRVPIMPKISIGGEQKRALTPEEQERQKQIDADYKAATSKIPAQKAPDPWADVRQAPASSGQKPSASAQNASALKKKQSAQQPQ